MFIAIFVQQPGGVIMHDRFLSYYYFEPFCVSLSSVLFYKFFEG